MDKMMIAACLSVFCGVSLWAATEAVDDTDVVEGPEAKAFAVEESAPLKEVADIEGPGVEAFAVEKPAPLKEVADIDRMSVVKVPVCKAIADEVKRRGEEDGVGHGGRAHTRGHSHEAGGHGNKLGG